jgi:hypothetical protein
VVTVIGVPVVITTSVVVEGVVVSTTTLENNSAPIYVSVGRPVILLSPGTMFVHVMVIFLSLGKGIVCTVGVQVLSLSVVALPDSRGVSSQRRGNSQPTGQPFPDRSREYV